MKKLLFFISIAFLMVLSGNAQGANVVVNPGFEDGKNPWKFYTNGTGNFVVTSPAYEGAGAARITTTTIGTNIQFFQPNVPLEPNTDYELSFAAYSNTGHDIRVSLCKHGPPYTNYGLSKHLVNLTTSWVKHTINFTTKNFNSPVNDARLMFWLASDAVAGDRYWIDDVVLRRDSCEQFDLTATVIGGHGTVSPTSGTYCAGSVVTLEANHDTGYHVKQWTGTDDDTSSNNTNAVTMNGGKVVTVEFESTPPTYYDVNGHYYQLIAVPQTWTDARSMAEQMTYNGFPGHLVTFSSQEENDWVYSTLGEGTRDLDSCWIGAYQQEGATEPDGGWQWVTEEHWWLYSNWGDGEPNNFGAPDINENAVQFSPWDNPGEWSDTRADVERSYIVEYEPVPIVIQLTNNSSNYSKDENPQIHNGQVVWQMSDSTWLFDGQIWYWDGTSPPRRIGVPPLEWTTYENPQIHNGQVVWDWDFSVMFWDGMNPPQELNGGGASGGGHSQIHNGQVVWQEWDGNDFEISYWSGSGDPVRLTDNEYDNHNPQIHDGQVVWQGHDGNDQEIFYWDGIGAPQQLTDNDYNDYDPQIHNGQVVWQDGQVGESGDSIYYWNGESVEVFSGYNYIPNYYTYSRDPKIHNGKLVWWGEEPYCGVYSPCTRGIFYYDGINPPQQLTYNHDRNPQIHNGQIVWQGYDGHDDEIFFWDGIKPPQQLTYNDYDDTTPQIHNGQVVWQGFDGNDYEIFFCIVDQPVNNVVNNPGFEDGKNPWKFYTNGTGNFVVTSPAYEGAGAARITTTTIGTNIQFFQYDLPLEPNTEYDLSFAAYSNTGHDLRVTLCQHGPPYTNYGLAKQSMNLSMSWNKYSINFTTKNFGSPVSDGRLTFWLADDAAPGDEYWIDHVILCQVGGAVFYNLSASVIGGNGTVSPTIGTHPEGTVVTLTATSDTGYRVKQWNGTGDDSLKTVTNTVTMTSDKTVTVEFEEIPPVENVVVNPGFEAGKSPWKFYTNGTGNFVVTSPAYEGRGAARITTTTSGTNIQFFQYDLPLEPNTEYDLSFAAYSNTGHDLRVTLCQHGPPYNNYGLAKQIVNLTTSWDTYSINFTTKNFSSPVNDSRLSFWLATDSKDGDQYWIDEVVLHAP